MNLPSFGLLGKDKTIYIFVDLKSLLINNQHE